MVDLDTLPDRIKAIRREIRAEYLQPHAHPWIIGFSGGKDSTLLAREQRARDEIEDLFRQIAA